MGAAVAAICLVLSAVVAIGSPAEAAPRKFREVTVKVMQVYAVSHEDRITPLAVVCVGRAVWDPSPAEHSCPSYAYGSEYLPSVRSFKVTFRWFAGRHVIGKKTLTIKNHTSPVLDKAPTRYLSGSVSAASGAWRWKGKPLSLTVTLSKKGYATKVVRIANKKFGTSDDG